MNKHHSKVLWITRTGVLIALLIALQWATGFLGNQLITGSCVNTVLAVTAMFAGLWSGVVVAIVSPFFAFLLNVGPKLIQVIPFIALGNLVYVLCLSLLLGKGNQSILIQTVGLAAASAGKLAALYFGVVRLLIPLMGESIPAKQAAALSAMFSWPQLVTALIGGAIALLIVPALKKAIKR